MFAWIRFVIMLTAVAISGQNEVQLSVQGLDEKGSLLPCRAWFEVEGQRFFEPTGRAASSRRWGSTAGASSAAR